MKPMPSPTNRISTRTKSKERRQDEDGGESPRIGFRNIPTWQDAIGVIIAKNMESRTRNPGGLPRLGWPWRPRRWWTRSQPPARSKVIQAPATPKSLCIVSVMSLEYVFRSLSATAGPRAALSTGRRRCRGCRTSRRSSKVCKRAML